MNHAWLVHIGETEPECVAEVLATCAKNPEALDYYRTGPAMK